MSISQTELTIPANGFVTQNASPSLVAEAGVRILVAIAVKAAAQLGADVA